MSLTEIMEAKARIQDLTYRTPTYPTQALPGVAHIRLHLKMECFQPIGVFKIRGAANKLRQLSEGEGAGGVVTASTGNHGQAVAYVASRLGFPATVCVPKRANPDKLAAIRRFGAEVVEAGKTYDEAYRHALAIQKKSGAVFVHPFDDPAVIAGQGTIGLEVLEDVPEVDTIIVPVGGGGLITGIAVAAKTLKPSVKVVGVQSKAAPSMHTSLARGVPITVPPKTIADGLAAGRPGALTFSLAQKFVDRILLVEDEELLKAMAIILKGIHVLTEPAGAAAVAGLYRYRPRRSEVVVAILSGANASREWVVRALAASP